MYITGCNKLKILYLLFFPNIISYIKAIPSNFFTHSFDDSSSETPISNLLLLQNKSHNKYFSIWCIYQSSLPPVR